MAIPNAEHWGALSTRNEYDGEMLSHDFKKLLCQGALNMEVERSEAESEENTNAYAIKLPAEIGAMDETILHSLLLDPYVQKMESLIQEVRESDEIDSVSPPVIPPIPEKPLVIQRLPAVPLSKENARYLLRKSCATILAHVGFVQTTNMVEDLLTDVLDGFLKQLMGKIRIALDQTARAGPAGFAYPLFRAFTEMGIEPLEIRDYFYLHVKKHNDSLLKTAQALHTECSELVKSKLAEVKEQEVKGEYEEENIPELHFPALGEDQLQSSLEPGFQMLDSLEHDESLQNLDADEEIIVNDSPSHEYVLSTSSDFSSPTDAQSRVKKRKIM